MTAVSIEELTADLKAREINLPDVVARDARMGTREAEAAAQEIEELKRALTALTGSEPA